MIEVEGVKSTGRPEKTWMEVTESDLVIDSDLKHMNPSMSDALDCKVGWFEV